MNSTIRNLKAEEIEIRVGSCKKNGCSLLLYKNSRCDMQLLDETYGVTGWKREHSRDNKNCTISIWDEVKKQWISKEDTGQESNSSKEKGLASDSFKRAGVNLGIGRELYSAPFIWIKLNNNEITEKEYNGKKTYKPNYGLEFKVSEIETTENKQIVKLKIVDSEGKERFKYAIPNPMRVEIFKLLNSDLVPVEDKELYFSKIKADSSLVNSFTVKEIKSKYFG